ncbi:transketolase subunit B [Eubacterium oxidoreducens]|uniref:Transketolase subunit B n=2 Tax=Eubacterium oxidoreducens TaxID=1732 RepID=A0A1G6B4F9_EUBOX|nr:transketolase subunit B [Eubacterium oxidoreducens]
MEIKKSEIKAWGRLGTRATFGLAILKLAEENQDFYVVSADLAKSSGLDRFTNKYPDMMINAGIAEQNMIGMAAGLAKDGTPVFATSFAPFISMRASEQIRMNMGYMGLNIKAVGLGSGLAMTTLGASHYGLEDVSVMRTIPGMTILSPADTLETAKCVEAAKNHKGPVYIRLTGSPENKPVYTEDYEYEIGKSIVLRPGDDIVIVAAGTMVFFALQTAGLLAEKGIEAKVINMHTIKPLDEKMLDDIADAKLLVTMEEHTTIGGMGSAVAEYYAGKEVRPKHLLLGIPDVYPHAGSYHYLLEQCGLMPEQMAEKIIQNMG